MKGYNAFFIVLVSVLASRGPMVQGVIPPSSPPPPPVDVDCDYGYALHKVRSQYSTVAPDRHWQWECIKVRIPTAVVLYSYLSSYIPH